MPRRLAIVAVALASATLLSGCVAIKSVVGAQQDIVGKLRVTVVVCKVDTGTINHPGCNYQSNAGEGSSTVSQLLLALRVPVGTGVPQTVSGTTNDGVPQTLSFTRDAGYEAQLAARVPPGSGRVWVGYLSGAYTYAAGANGTPAREVSVAIDLDLPRPAGGGPYVGSLPVVAAAGGRAVLAGMPASRAVSCAASAYAISADNTVCVDSPLPAAIDAAYNLPTRDFGIVAGKATASPGQSVALPFNVRGAGALPAGLTATLSAATALPGVDAVAPSAATVPLANGSDTRVTVPVEIPRDAGPGTFDVTLTGTLANGQTRTGVAKLTVRDRQKPVLAKAKAKPKRFEPATKRRPKRGTNVSFTLSEAAKVRLTVERCAKRKRGRCVRWRAMKGGLTKPGVQGANAIRFAGRLRGKALKAGAYRLVLTPTDPAANVGKAVRVSFAVRR